MYLVIEEYGAVLKKWQFVREPGKGSQSPPITGVAGQEGSNFKGGDSLRVSTAHTWNLGQLELVIGSGRSRLEVVRLCFIERPTTS